MSEIFTETVPVPAGELVAFGLAMEQAQKALSALGAARAEWLCEPCKTVHPWQSGDFILVPCPDCETPMTPTSPALRDLQQARAELAELRAENASLSGSVELKHTAPYIREAAATAERDRIRAAAEGLRVIFWRPGNGPGREEALEVVPLADLLGILAKGDGDD